MPYAPHPPPSIDADAQLLCPKCKQPGGMHHENIKVFQRDSEDGPATAVDIVTEGGAVGISVPRVVVSRKDNPPGRRGSVFIHFRCECGATSELRIVQHKGATIIKMAPTWT